MMQLCIGGWQAFNLFWSQPTYGWWLSSAAIGLHVSSQIHSLVAWMKIKPFLSRRSSQVFLGTLLLVQPYWAMEIFATFTYFNNNTNTWLFPRTRPIEALFRDPWWVASCGKLLWVIKGHYDISLRNVVIINPRFGVMMVAMLLSLVFVVLDIFSVTGVFKNAPTVGVNPFWKLALVFKCLTDTVILDDFKTALDRMWTFRRESLSTAGGAGVGNRWRRRRQKKKRQRELELERGRENQGSGQPQQVSLTGRGPTSSSNGKPSPAVNTLNSSREYEFCYVEQSSSSRDYESRNPLEAEEALEEFEMTPPPATAQRSM